MSTKNNWRDWLNDELDPPSDEKIPHRHNGAKVRDDALTRNRASLDNNAFKCCHCKAWVESDPAVCGVKHRNHCPYCLHSRHLDALKAGDRLSGCLATMRPVGLTLKRSRNKYAREDGGELMLIHHCLGCGRLSINRIAADDNAESLLEVFNASANMQEILRSQIASQGIHLLGVNDLNIILTRLYGVGMNIQEWNMAERLYLDAD